MTENTNNHTSESEALKQLSERVGKALERDAHRRRWASRGLTLLAIIPVVAVVLVFLYGRSDVKQTEQIVQQRTLAIEDDVAKRVTASVAQELKGVSEVRELLPELREAVPQVQKNSQELKKTMSQIARVDKLDQSIDAVRSELETTRRTMTQEFSARVKQLGNRNNLQRLNRIEEQLRLIDGKMDSAIRKMGQEFDARFQQLQGANQSQRLNAIERRLSALEGKMKNAAGVFGVGVHEVNTINTKLTELYKMSHDLNSRVRKLENPRVNRLMESGSPPIAIEQPQR